MVGCCVAAGGAYVHTCAAICASAMFNPCFFTPLCIFQYAHPHAPLHHLLDGSTYVGFWQHGQQHGEGVYKPSGPQRAEVVFIQAYRAGTLLREQVLRVDDLDVPRRQESKRGAKQFGVDALPIDNQAPVSPTDASGSAREASGSTGPQQQGSLSTQPTGTITPHAVAGTVVIKGHRSYELIRQLQLGLLFSVAQASAAALDTHPATTTINNNSSTPCLPPEAFTQQLTQYFPATSDMSYPFRWKDYAPMAFTHLRAVFGIDSTEYLLSLAGQGALREMPSPGKSGSTFFLSQDDRFLIKTVTREEMRMLLRLVPEYYQHVAGHASTLLTRFYGVHRVQHLNGSSTRFVVMGNVFPSDVRLQRKVCVCVVSCACESWWCMSNGVVHNCGVSYTKWCIPVMFPLQP